MVRLVVLGTTDLRDAAGDPIHSLLRQPRRFALLAFLALESRGGPVRRDRVLSVFWPEVPQADGRRSLSQALHYLRRALGPDALLTRGAEDLQLDLSTVSCDACDFLAALAADADEAALRLYRGDLLPAFYGGAPDFDDWLDRTREELRRRAAAAAWSAAEAAAAQDAGVAAGAHARRAAELTGGDEPAVRRLMELLARLGDRAGALAAFGALAERLEREYEAEPDAPTAALAARIRETTSAPPVPPVAVAVVANGAERPADAVIAASAPAVPEGDVGFGPASLRFRQRARSAAVTVALMFGFISLFGLRRGADLEAAPAPLNARLLVEDARGPADVAEALTSDIVRRLAGAERIEVFVGSPPAGAEPLFLLRTTVRTDADTLRATAILTDRATGAALASMRAKEPVATGRAAERLGAAVVRFARRATGTELERREAELADVAGVARTAWLRGRNDLADADSLYDAGLGDAARVRLAAADSLLASAQRAADDWVQVPLDRAELELLRMWVRLTQPGGGWAAARPALALGIGHADDALRIAPRDTRALELRGVLQALLWLTTPSDSARAADPLLNAAYRDLKRATEHSGAAPRAWQYLSMIEFARGDFAQAYHAADRALDADAFLGDATGVRTQHFWSALEVGDTAGARRSCVRQGADDPESWHGSYCRMVLLAWPGNATPDLPDAMQLVSAAERKPWAAQNRGSLDAIHAVLLAQRGDAAGARDLLARVLHDSETRPELLHEAAWVYVTLGEPDRARELLERYVAGWPAARTGVTRSRRFAGVLD